MMKEQNIIKELQMDVKIPKVVQNKTDAAFTHICGNSLGAKAGHAKFPVKRVAVMIAAATLALAGISAAAAYFYWSRSFSEGMQITEEYQVKLEQQHAVAFAMQECETNGIKVTAVQSITDSYFTHIVLKVEGYQLPEDAEPCFENIEISVDGDKDIIWESSFYNGIITGKDGTAVYADGKSLDTAQGGRIEHYLLEDGSMEYRITLSSDRKGFFINKKIHVELQNLGTAEKAEFIDGIEGVWEFEWNLSGTEKMREYTLHEILGDTGATVIKAEISPVSFHVEYEFPKDQIKEEGINEAGETVYSNEYKEPPMFTGFKMKDGAVYSYLQNGGSYGYQSENSEIYYATFAMSRIIDVEQIQSLLFVKSYPQNGEAFSEADFYEVSIDNHQ